MWVEVDKEKFGKLFRLLLKAKPLKAVNVKCAQSSRKLTLKKP